VGEPAITSAEEIDVKTRVQQASRHGVVSRPDELLTVEEVCNELKVSRRTFDRWRALGTGPRSTRIGGSGPVRVRRSWLDEWLELSGQDIA
jgi:excisionase family DNA binding protein